MLKMAALLMKQKWYETQVIGKRLIKKKSNAFEGMTFADVLKLFYDYKTRCFIMYDFREVFYTMCTSRYP